MFRHCRHETPQLGGIDQLLVHEAAQAEIGDALAEAREFGLALGHQHGAVGVEAAIVADQLLDAFPDVHRGDRQRYLMDVARQLPHAARIDARGVAAGIVLLDQDRLQAAQREMQRRRAAMDAAADDHDIGRARHPSAPRPCVRPR